MYLFIFKTKKVERYWLTYNKEGFNVAQSLFTIGYSEMLCHIFKLTLKYVM